jgi:hypothetical protein
MKVNVKQDRMGSVLVTPVSVKACEAYESHMEEMTDNATCTAYLQEWRGEEFIDTYVPARKRHDVRLGYTVTILMNRDEFGNLLGYDASEVDW